MSAADRDGAAPADHRFVLVGDSCAGMPGGPHAQTFAAISGQIEALRPDPDFICFLGDHIEGLTADEQSLRDQWRYWCDREFAWTKARGFPVYHLTSNHNTYDAMSERVFREIFPDLPQNGPPGDRGLSYFVRRDDLLLVCTNSATARLGPGRIETEWIAEVLAQHHDVPHKLVLGHYPILPVNGYAMYPRWRIPPDSGDVLWRLLVEHEVMAYVCSHVIAYDIRARDGVLQICSAGAGTRYGPTGDFMRGEAEFFHFLVCHLQGGQLRGNVIDDTGRRRRQLRWPLREPDHPARPVTPDLRLPERFDRLGFDIAAARSAGAVADADRETLVCGYDLDEGPPTIWIGRERGRLVVEILLWPGGPVGRWRLDGAQPPERFGLDIVADFGPGGVMAIDHDGRRTSLASSVADDLDRVRWPRHWCLGHGPSGPTDEPYGGDVTAAGRFVD